MKRTHENTCDTSGICLKVALVERNTSPGGYALVNASKTAKKGHSDVVQLAMEIEKADEFVRSTACSKLQVIAEQVQFLRQQAVKVLEEAKFNKELHHIACNFRKVPGNIYHLYRRESGQHYFSMLSPEEWTSPHEYFGSFRLEHNRSWTKAGDINDAKLLKVDDIRKLIGYTNQSNLNLALGETPMDL